MGAALTVTVDFAAKAAVMHVCRPFDGYLFTLLGIIMVPAWSLVSVLRLPIEFFHGDALFPTTSALIFATIVNTLILSALGTLLSWIHGKSRKPKSS